MNADAPRPAPHAGCASDDAEVTAWVVVHGEPGDLRYFVRHPLGDRFAEWSPDHMRAARFLSRESAEIAARWEWEMDARVEEHMWVSRPVPPAITPAATAGTETHKGFRRHKTLPNPHVPGAEDIHADDCWCQRPAAPTGEEAETDGDRRMLLVWEAWARREGNEGAALLFKRVADRLDELTAARNRWHGKWKAAHEGAERIEADLRAQLTAQATALAALRARVEEIASENNLWQLDQAAMDAEEIRPAIQVKRLRSIHDALAALAPHQTTSTPNSTEPTND